MTNLIVLFGFGLALALLKWAMDELFIHRQPRRPRQPVRLLARPMPMPAPMGRSMQVDDDDADDDDEDWGVES